MLNIRYYLLLSFLCLYFLNCKQIDSKFSPEVNGTSLDTVVEYSNQGSQTNISRAIWQKPNLIIERLGNISAKTIADIGSGTGYFAFKLANTADKIIAVDIDKHMINYIDSTKNLLPLEIKNKIETRLATPNDPNLSPLEVDIILIINTIAYLPDLKKYLENVTKSLKPNGKILIIDYKMKKLPINAPPKEERIYLDVVEDILSDLGYRDINSDDTTLDYQYIIEASKP